MPKLRDMIGGTKTKIYFQATMLDLRPCSTTDHQRGSE